MGWVSAFLALLQFVPQIIAAVKALIDAIKAKNAEKGSSAVSEAATLAAQIVTSLAARHDLSNEAKRELAVSDLLVGAKMVGVILSESQARTLVELSYQQVKGA